MAPVTVVVINYSSSWLISILSPIGLDKSMPTLAIASLTFFIIIYP